MELKSQQVQLNQLVPTEGYVIVNKADYEKETSLENQILPDDEQFKAARSEGIYLGKGDSEDNYIEIPDETIKETAEE